MHGINGVSPTGIESKLQQKVDGSSPVSNPINTAPSPVDTALSADMRGGVPLCDKSLAVNPTLSSEYLLNEKDLKRYNGPVRRKIAEIISEEQGVPVEHIMARLPEVKFGDAEAMLKVNEMGNSFLNFIQINPMRKMTGLCGGGDSHAAHEFSHTYNKNNVIAYVKELELSQNDIINISLKNVIEKMRNGEHYPIIKEYHVEKDSKGNLIYIFKKMDPPPLNANERNSLIDVLKLLKEEHIDITPDQIKLNDAGRAFVKEALFPQLEEYKKLFSGSPEKVEEKMLKKIGDYIDTLHIRKSFIYECLNPECCSLEESLKTPLEGLEPKAAEKYIANILSLEEGNNLNSSIEQYFMLNDEIIARRRQTVFRQRDLDQKMADIRNLGLEPGETLLKEQQTLKNNLKLLELTEELADIEEQIISAPKNPEKLKEIIKMKEELEAIYKNPEFTEIQKYINELNEDINTYLFSSTTNKEFSERLKANLPKELEKDLDTFMKHKIKTIELNLKITELNTPRNLLSDVVENNTLKTQFDGILGEIRKISKKCDLAGIPESFFASKEEFKNAIKKTSHVIAQCKKLLAKVRV